MKNDSPRCAAKVRSSMSLGPQPRCARHAKMGSEFCTQHARARGPVEIVTLLKPDGTREAHPYPTVLKGWQTLVGGYIEVVQLKEHLLVVDEDGLGKGLPVNIEASRIARRPLVGNAVLVEGAAAERWFREG